METGEIAGEGQSDTGAGHTVGELVTDALKGLKYSFALSPWNARTAIANGNRGFTAALLAFDRHRVSGGGIFFNVVDEVTNNLFQGIMIEEDIGRRVGLKGYRYTVFLEGGFEMIENGLDGLVDYAAGGMDLQLIPLLPAEI